MEALRKQVLRMSAVRVKLNFNAFQVLIKELKQNELSAIYAAIYSIGAKHIPETVSSMDLITVIGYLCKKLNWIEYYEEATEPLDIKPAAEEANLDLSELKHIPPDMIRRHYAGLGDDIEIPPKENYFCRDIGIGLQDIDHIQDTRTTNSNELKAADNSVTSSSSSKSDVIKKDFYDCSRCGKKFKHCECTDKETIKYFNCTYCDYKTNHKCNLKKHERVHTDERPFRCFMCDKKFKDSSTLTAHERIHTGYKPYSCSKCDYKCTQKGPLYKHERNCTGKTPRCHTRRLLTNPSVVPSGEETLREFKLKAT